MPKANPNQIRLPVMFDLTDPRQKAAYEILKNAGYGKRTPIIVDALLDSLKTNVLLSQAKEPSASNVSETDIRRAVEDSMESVLNRYFPKPPPRNLSLNLYERLHPLLLFKSLPLYSLLPHHSQALFRMFLPLLYPHKHPYRTRDT